jgi:hypothetical protein
MRMRSGMLEYAGAVQGQASRNTPLNFQRSRAALPVLAPQGPAAGRRCREAVLRLSPLFD